MDVYGYIRVSSVDQSEARQLIALRAGAWRCGTSIWTSSRERTFTGLSTKRLVKALKPGDLLYVLSIDRLGRDYMGDPATMAAADQGKGGTSACWTCRCWTPGREKDLMGTFIADLVRQILSFVAQSERENIRRRQQEGIAVAKARG